MKKYALICMLLGLVGNAQAQTANFSVQFGQPGFYGQINLGQFPRPELAYPEVRVVQPGSIGLAPMYLVVPPGHFKHWDKHCARYRACQHPVYFVKESWYNEHVVPHYQDGRGNEGEVKAHGKGKHGKHGKSKHDD